MKNCYWTPLVLVIVMSLCTVAWADDFLADRHGEKGVSCADCHDTDTPEKGTFVAMDKCLACHGPYEDLAVKTDQLGKKNPHNSHVGNLDCTVCHYGHAPSVLYCTKCHTGLGLVTP